jgi:two-component system, LytTR family, response regulator
MNKIRAIIIEDEDNSALLLQQLLEEFCNDVIIVGRATSIEDGVRLLLKTPCDLVFMDMQLEDGISFDILDQIGKKEFSIIVTTAHDHYAVSAFKHEAVDYLLKPFSPSDIVKAIEKARKLKKDASEKQLKDLLVEANLIKHQKKISLATEEGFLLIDPTQIIYCKGDGAYSTIHLQDKSKVLVSKSIGEMETLLNSENFIRVHTSHLVNIDHIYKFVKVDGGSIVMNNGRTLPVSRRKRQDFIEKISAVN